jgi:hypothetical protein
LIEKEKSAMIENENIQQTGFHNLKDKDGKIWGFQLGLTSQYYKGLYLSQMRFGDAVVDGIRYPKDTLLWNFQGIDYSRQEMFDRMDIYWPVNAVVCVKVPKPGGLTQGYHDVYVEWGYVNNYNNGLEKELDGSKFGNSGPWAPNNMMGGMGGPGGTDSTKPPQQRRLLLVW